MCSGLGHKSYFGIMVARDANMNLRGKRVTEALRDGEYERVLLYFFLIDTDPCQALSTEVPSGVQSTHDGLGHRGMQVLHRLAIGPAGITADPGRAVKWKRKRKRKRKRQ